MRKRWRTWCVVYLLGVATIPGAMLATRWLRSSDSQRPKFTEAVYAEKAEENAAPIDDVAQFETLVLAENSEPSLTDSNFNFTGPSATEPPRLTKSVLVSPLTGDWKLRSGPVEFNAPPPAHQSQTAPQPPSLDFDDFLAVDLKPPQRTTNLDDEFRESVEREPVTIVPKRPPADISNSKADVPDGIESLAEPNPSDEQKAKLTSLREKLAELMKAKAELINEQTLSQEVSALEKQISDLHAAQKLWSAQEILKALVEEFPQSPAAIRAKRMLEAAGMKPAAWKVEPLRPQPQPVEDLPTYR